MKRVLVLIFAVNALFAYMVKTPSDVYSYAMLLKQKVKYLREKAGINKPFPNVPPQTNKYPRHVIQKALEILSKINLYRVRHGYGSIFIPPYPAREITPSDVYEMVKRDDAEITVFIKDIKFLKSLKLKKYKGKTPNDVYRLLWSISLAMDDLLGIRGYTPTQVYGLASKLLKIVEFLRQTQNIYVLPPMPPKLPNRHPNHALYKSYEFLDKVRKAEINLWINNPTDVPKTPHKVITPTEVYDSIQYNIAELQRIKYRLGVERYFKSEIPKETKTPSDVVQILSYASEIMPLFDFKKTLIQYPPSSLAKTPNNVYAVTQVILKKLNILKNLKGIQAVPKNPPYIPGLKPIYAYQKAIEATEKAIRLKTQMGFYPSQVPEAPLRKITPNEVYEMVIRLDGIITILLNSMGYKTEEYIYMTDKKIPRGKTPSDVYFNLWKISNTIDVLLASEYTPNETFLLSKKMKNKILVLLKHMHIKKSAIQHTLQRSETYINKTPKDVFLLTEKLFSLIKKTQKRFNIEISNIVIPQEKIITPNTVYNALRITNASINELLIKKNVNEEEIPKIYEIPKNKTPDDVYKNVEDMIELLKLLFNEADYEN
ncbi:hypothetical protein [Caminibacter pacificus]|uniref:Uncharacterized protein n=1 Tax=Caminibacter pacificus TaxID=1424653 RepID=A0AAJ4RE09_9BACT|nr:hypothetical protein [Caminibacter pacificus]NPA88549.1 hypothetical protein [Campylobacterota bacterium]QCI28291.1 hypothetical protein C6V80_04755 [Caminibacter pacificus]ROR40995.1 hypothetical protein EDC58_0478 [Caminibacter pacificus]